MMMLLTVLVTFLIRLWTLDTVRNRIFGWVGKLPRALQWVAPMAVAMLVAAGQGWIDGLRGEALLEKALADGGQIGAMAIGVWHTAKRLKPANPEAK